MGGAVTGDRPLVEAATSRTSTANALTVERDQSGE
jgi:hypothetical protein